MRTTLQHLFASLLIGIFSLTAQSAFAQFDYGTGLIASNPTGGTATIAYIGNDAIITASGTIATGSTGVYNFHNFTINAGVTVTITGSAPLIIKCTGTATINGTITAAGGAGTYGSAYNASVNYALGGAGGTGGGGGWGAAGGKGDSARTGSGTSMFGYDGGNFASFSGGGKGGQNYNPANVIQAGTGGSYGTLGGTAPATTGFSPGNTRLGTIYGNASLTTTATSNSITTNLLGGSGGGGGGGRNQTSNTASIWGGCGGGGGGGAMRVTANDIAFGASGLISVRGGDGGSDSSIANPPGHGVGAGGGGTGGTVHLQYAVSLTNAVLGTTPALATGSTIDIAGGSGGYGANVSGVYYTIGGAGGQGRYLAEQDPNTTTTCVAPTLTAKANGSTSPAPNCNATINLSANSTGGSGCSTYTEYAWFNGTSYWNGTSFGASSATYTRADSNITVTQPNSSTVTYTVTGRCNSATTCVGTSTVSFTALNRPTTTITSTICPGQSYGTHTTSGTYTDTYTAASGCDSIRTLNLTVLNPNRTTVTETICSGDSMEGYTVSGTYIDTFVSFRNCDSIRTLNLTVLNPIITTITKAICPGQSFEGYSTQGNYTDTFLAANGCDSVRIIHLSVTSSITTTENKTLCPRQSYAGHLAPGTFIDTLTATGGCDSIRTLNLEVLTATNHVVKQVICQGDTFAGHTTPGLYLDTVRSVGGCDSIRNTLELEVDPAHSIPTITQHGDTLISSAAGTYAWYDGNTLLSTTSGILVITHSGQYTVVVSDSITCPTASSIFDATYTGVEQVGKDAQLSIYPNPTNGIVNISLKGVNANSETTIRVYDQLGRVLLMKTLPTSAKVDYQLNMSDLANGLYLIKLQQDDWHTDRKLLIAK